MFTCNWAVSWLSWLEFTENQAVVIFIRTPVPLLRALLWPWSMQMCGVNFSLFQLSHGSSICAVTLGLSYMLAVLDIKGLSRLPPGLGLHPLNAIVTPAFFNSEGVTKTVSDYCHLPPMGKTSPDDSHFSGFLLKKPQSHTKVYLKMESWFGR